MWNNKKKEEEYAPRVVATPPAAQPSMKEGLPLSTAPVRTTQDTDSRGAASIGKSVTIKGQIFSREDLIVDGEIEGAIELNETAFLLGFENANSFFRAFQVWEGTSPGEWRTRHRTAAVEAHVLSRV